MGSKQQIFSIEKKFSVKISFAIHWVEVCHLVFSKKWKGVDGSELAWPRDGSGRLLNIELTMKRRLKVENSTEAIEDENFVESFILTENNLIQKTAYVVECLGEGKYKIKGMAEKGTLKVSGAGGEETKQGVWEYYLVEKTVDGYQDPVYISVNGGEDEDGVHNNGVIENKLASYELPSTGGAGTTAYTLVGALLILGAAILLARRRFCE